MLELSRIASLVPQSWRNFVPNPRSYKERVYGDAVAAGVVSPGSKKYGTISGVPRYFHPRAGEDALALSLELNVWYFYFDDIFDDAQSDVINLSNLQAELLIDRMLCVLETGKLPLAPFGTERICQQFRQRSRWLCHGRERTGVVFSLRS